MRYLMMLLILILGAACAIETSQGNEEAMRLETNKKGWSASGTLTKGQPLKVIELQADFSTQETTNYTAQFKLTGNLIRAKTSAEITWSVEGNQIRRKISVADGTSIQGAGQAVKIKVYDESTLNLAPLGGLINYEASVSVVPGTRGSTTNPPILDTIARQTIAAAGQTSFPVPGDAGVTSVLVLVSGGPAAAVPIAVGDICVSQLSTPPLIDLADYDPLIVQSWIPLIPGCNEIVVTNNNAAPVNVKVIWGIDG